VARNPGDARDAAREDDPGVADHRSREHRREAVDRDQDRAFERDRAFEKRRQSQRQLTGQNRKGRAETDAHEQRELIGKSADAVPALDGKPCRQNEIEREDADEHIDPLVGHHETQVTAEYRHHPHCDDEHRSGLAVEAPALARDHRNRPGYESDRTAADVQNEGEKRQGMQNRRLHLGMDLDPIGFFGIDRSRRAAVTFHSRARSTSSKRVNGAEQVVPVQR
jgi:hypothetical protein